jgi:hypothetical protein
MSASLGKMMTAHDHHEHSKPFWESMATDTEDA